MKRPDKSSLVSVSHVVKHRLDPLLVQKIVITVIMLGAIVQVAVLGMNTHKNDSVVLDVQLGEHTIGKIPTHNLAGQIGSKTNAFENRSIPVTVEGAKHAGTITLRQLESKDREYTALLDVNYSEFDWQLMWQAIKKANQNMSTPPVEAHFSIANQTVTLTPDTKGMTINADTAIKKILGTNPEDDSLVILPVKFTAASLNSPLLQPILHQAQNIAERPLTITAAKQKITLSRKDLLDLIVLNLVSDTQTKSKLTIRISFDEVKLHSYINKILSQASITPESTVVHEGHVIKQGKDGLKPTDKDPVRQASAVLVDRKKGQATVDSIDIPMVNVAAPVIELTANNPTHQTGTGLVRLTFDDGPGGHTEQVLDILKRYNVHATFYVIGRHISGHESTLQRIHREGHSLGNHSLTHSDLTRLSPAEVLQELATAQMLIQQASGVTPISFRPPYGAQNQVVRQAAASLGLSVDLWSVDPEDWLRPEASVIAERVLNHDGAGSVILLHSLHKQTVDALPAIIEGIRAQGYTLE